MHIEESGAGPDLLVLLHGLGATGAVWSPMRERAAGHWPGRILIVDLPGHGASPRQRSYAVGQSAAAVARAVLPHVDAAGTLTVLGHSLGGVLAMALATGWFGVTPQRVFGVGIKVAWNDEELQRLAALATQPARSFDTEAAAWDRYAKVSGLAGLATAESPVVARGVVRDEAGWRLAMDPAANAVGRPPLAELARVARCPVHLGRGRDDALATLADTRAIDPAAIDVGPYGHNVMVEAPDAVWAWLRTER